MGRDEYQGTDGGCVFIFLSHHLVLYLTLLLSSLSWTYIPLGLQKRIFKN